MSEFGAALVHAAAVFAAAGILTRLAPRLAWLDPRPGAPELARKTQRLPAAPVGGVALLLCFGGWSTLDFGGDYPWPLDWDFIARVDPLQSKSLLLSTLAALALGTLDDRLREGLAPWAKLLGQVLVLSLTYWLIGGPLSVLLALFVAFGLVVLNVVNAFDHADGACPTLGALGLAIGAPPLAAGCAALLPWNLRPGSARWPKLYLGDAGSHVVGLWILLTPIAWGALAVPVLDLWRLVIQRPGRGLKPWQADRFHFAHRLEDAGLPKPLIPFVIALCIAPSALLPGLGYSSFPAAIGLSAALYVLAVIAAGAWIKTLRTRNG